MADKAKYMASHPGDTAKAMFLPPPGTNPAVQSLYYAQIADMTYDATKGLTKGAKKMANKAGPISKKLLQRVGIKGLEKYAYSQTRNAISAGKGLTGLKMLRPIKNALTGAKAAITATKWGARGAQLLENLSAGPAGLVVDAVMIGMMVYGVIFDALDKSGIGNVLSPEYIKQTVAQITSSMNDKYAEAGLTDYFYAPAEFPVTDLIFQWDDTAKTYTTTSEWGPMYAELMDKYMTSQGFDKNWRDNVDAQDGKSTGPSTLTKILVIIGVFLCLMLFLGGLFFVMSN